jgi:hypothetical protein
MAMAASIIVKWSWVSESTPIFMARPASCFTSTPQKGYRVARQKATSRD